MTLALCTDTSALYNIVKRGPLLNAEGANVLNYLEFLSSELENLRLEKTQFFPHHRNIFFGTAIRKQAPFSFILNNLSSILLDEFYFKEQLL